MSNCNWFCHLQSAIFYIVVAGFSHLSEEAGLLSKKYPASPWSLLAEATASLIAKNADDAKKNGGSPTAYPPPGAGA